MAFAHRASSGAACSTSARCSTSAVRSASARLSRIPSRSGTEPPPDRTPRTARLVQPHSDPAAPSRKHVSNGLERRSETMGPTDAEHLASAIATTYNNKLRELKRVMTPTMLEELRSSLPPEQLASLDLILSDLSSLPDDPGLLEAQEPLQAEELKVLEDLEAVAQDFPEDFASYLDLLRPEGMAPEQFWEVLAGMDEALLQQLAGLYEELRHFAAADLTLEEASAVYADLSQRMAMVAVQLRESLGGEGEELSHAGAGREGRGAAQEAGLDVGQRVSNLGHALPAAAASSNKDSGGGSTSGSRGIASSSGNRGRRRRATGSIFRHSSSSSSHSTSSSSSSSRNMGASSSSTHNSSAAAGLEEGGTLAALPSQRQQEVGEGLKPRRRAVVRRVE